MTSNEVREYGRAFREPGSLPRDKQFFLGGLALPL